MPLPVTTGTSRLPFLASNPALGLLTPGFILGTDLSRPIPTDPAYAPLGYKIGTFTVLPSSRRASATILTRSDDPSARQGLLGPAHRGRRRLPERLVVKFARWHAARCLPQDAGERRREPPRRGRHRQPARRCRPRPAFRCPGPLPHRHPADDDAEPQAATATSRPLVALYGGTVGATQTFKPFVGDRERPRGPLRVRGCPPQ